MYIRRKVFSILEDEMGEERYFSTTDIVYEGDVYEERDFSDEEKPRSHRARNIALGTAAGLVATGGAIYGAKKLGAKMIRNAETNNRLTSLAGKGVLTDKEEKAAEKILKKIKIAEALQKPADVITNVTKKGVSSVSEKSKEAISRVKEALKKKEKK